MKNFLLKPGFEFVFALSLIAIIGLPPIVFAQVKHDLEIKIVNGDTTVNGKNIKDLSTIARSEALNDINRLTQSAGPDGKNLPGQRHILIREQRTGDNDGPMLFRNTEKGMAALPPPPVEAQFIMKDTAQKLIKFNKIPDSAFMFSYHTFGDGPGRAEDARFDIGRAHRGPMMGFNRRNSQNFSYSATGKDGITTDVEFRVSDPSDEALKRIRVLQRAPWI